VGFAAQQVPRGTLMGFIVEIATSYLQVADVGGRFVLRDGNRAQPARPSPVERVRSIAWRAEA
jgi:hypothetical protein